MNKKLLPLLSSLLLCLSSNTKADDLGIEGPCKLTYSKNKYEKTYNIAVLGKAAIKIYWVLYNLKVEAIKGEDDNYVHYTRSTNTMRCTRFNNKKTKEEHVVCASSFGPGGDAGLPREFEASEKIEIFDECDLRIHPNNLEYSINLRDKISRHVWDNTSVEAKFDPKIKPTAAESIAYSKWGTHISSHEVHVPSRNMHRVLSVFILNPTNGNLYDYEMD